jgi:hypothetical protein
VPHNNNYLKPEQKWDFKLDERIRPSWWRKDYEKPCRLALKEWKKQIYTFNLKEARNPINPFKIKAPKEITKKHIGLIRRWASVWASVRASVGASVGDSVGDSVRDSVRDSVWDSVRDSVRDSVWDSVGASVRDSVRDSVWASVGDSVWDSVWAYYGSLFPNIKKWKYIDKFKIKGYLFQSVVDLWKMGLVAGYDGKKWMLFGSPKGNGKCVELWRENLNKNL